MEYFFSQKGQIIIFTFVWDDANNAIKVGYQCNDNTMCDSIEAIGYGVECTNKIL